MPNIVEKLAKIPLKKNVYTSLPETPGVYVFFTGNTPIYIGKAINLKRRVSSYFDINLIGKTGRMMAEAEYLSYIKVTSEFEALLLEANLIRKYMPHFNIAAKDDKHPLYIMITKEKYPRVLTVRKPDLAKIPFKSVYGPFPSSGNVRSVLKLLRRIFPYSDHKVGKRGCLYSHLGLCKPCPNEIVQIKDKITKKEAEREYCWNIGHIKAVLDGKVEQVKRNLEKRMGDSAAKENYEEAKNARDQIERLEYITRPQMPTDFYMENPNLYEDLRKREIAELRKFIGKGKLQTGKLIRIECFDVAHLAGTNPTASMVTFINGEADKSYYRHFKINQKRLGSDTDSMREVIIRRKNHFQDWGKPDLIIVDGGKAQVGVFAAELKGEGMPVVGIAKRFETLVIPTEFLGTTKISEFRLPKGNALNLVQRIRDEAHRFARRYHHHLISKVYRNENNN